MSILNACVKMNTMIDERICKACKEQCKHAGEATVAERLEAYEKAERKREFLEAVRLQNKKRALQGYYEIKETDYAGY